MPLMPEERERRAARIWWKKIERHEGDREIRIVTNMVYRKHDNFVDRLAEMKRIARAHQSKREKVNPPEEEVKPPVEEVNPPAEEVNPPLEIQYTPYRANIFSPEEIQEAQDWLTNPEPPPEPIREEKTKKEKYLEYQREYYRKNKEKMKAKAKENYNKRKTLNPKP